MKNTTFSRNGDAVSEVIGAILLVVIAVAAFAIIYSQVFPVKLPSPEPHVQLAGYVTYNGTVVLEHVGGAPLSSYKFRIEHKDGTITISPVQNQPIQIGDHLPIHETLNATNNFVKVTVWNIEADGSTQIIFDGIITPKDIAPGPNPVPLPDPMSISTLLTNTSDEDLICYNYTVHPKILPGPYTFIYNWMYKTDPNPNTPYTSLTRLLMPFDLQNPFFTKDYSGNNNNGTVVGAIWTNGKLGGAYRFSGGASIAIPYCFSVNKIDTVTIEVWIKTNKSSEVILSYNRSNYIELALSNGHVKWSTNASDGTVDVNGTLLVNDDNWHLIAVTYNATSGVGSIYVDGKLDTSQQAHRTNKLLGSGNSAAGAIGKGTGTTNRKTIFSTDFETRDETNNWNEDGSSALGIKDAVDSNACNVDGSADKGTETNFVNAQGTAPDGNSMTIQEVDTAGQDQKTAVQGNTCNKDSSPDLGTETNFANAQGTFSDSNNMTIREVDVAGNYKTAVQGDTTDRDSSPDLGTETNFANAQGTSHDNNNMTIREANQGNFLLNENKTVDSKDSTYTDWTQTGTTPYLNGDDYPTSFVTTGTRNYRTGWYTFSDTTATAGIINCTFYVNAWRDTSGGGDDYALFYVDYSGGAGSSLGQVCTSTSASAFQTFTLTGLTYTQANALRCYFYSQRTGSSMDHLYIDYVYVWFHRGNTTNYRLDFEYNWSSAHFAEATKQLCFYLPAHTGGAEYLMVKYWTGSAWGWVGNITAVGWTNLTARGLTSAIYTIRLNGSKGTGDMVQDSWFIDCMFLHCYNASNYRLDFEYNWSSAHFAEATKQLCFYLPAHTGGAEYLMVKYWTGSAWGWVGNITAVGWTNLTARGLTSAIYTIRLNGSKETGDTVQDSWFIDCIFLHTSNASNYQIDFEYQWTAAIYKMVNKQLCLYITSHTGSENLLVNYWTGSAWSSLGTVSSSGWFNVTATGLASSTYTIQVKGATESSDTSQDTWSIDVISLHIWTTQRTFDMLPSTVLTPHAGSYSLGGSGDFYPMYTLFNRTDINLSGYQNVQLSIWYSYKNTESNDLFGLYYKNNSQWNPIFEITNPTQSGQKEWTQVIITIPHTLNKLRLQFKWRTTSTSEYVAIDDLKIAGIPLGIDTNFTGIIDEVKIYQRELSPEQLYQNYLCTKNGTSSRSVLTSKELHTDERWKCLVTPNNGLLDDVITESNLIVIKIYSGGG